MISKIPFLNVLSIKSNLVEYKCPSCGSVCNEKTDKCEICSYDLKEHKSIILSKYLYFNNTIDFIEKKQYFNAILSITKFLAYMPNDEKGNELYIYLLYKNGQKKEYKEQLNVFEEQFKYSSFIINIEKNGIDKYLIPSKININCHFNNNSFEALLQQYNSTRYKTINDILDLELGFYSLYKAYENNKKNMNIKNFYEKKFLQFLSKHEISVESTDGKLYDELSDNEKKKLEVIGETNIPRKKEGLIVTVAPAVYIRSKLLSKEKVLISKKNKRWKK